MLTQKILSPQKEDKYGRGLVILDFQIYYEFPFAYHYWLRKNCFS